MSKSVETPEYFGSRITVKNGFGGTMQVNGPVMFPLVPDAPVCAFASLPKRDLDARFAGVFAPVWSAIPCRRPRPPAAVLGRRPNGGRAAGPAGRRPSRLARPR
jgi:hypothetical protein